MAEFNGEAAVSEAGIKELMIAAHVESKLLWVVKPFADPV
jgi:hypothetical protein